MFCPAEHEDVSGDRWTHLSHWWLHCFRKTAPVVWQEGCVWFVCAGKCFVAFIMFYCTSVGLLIFLTEAWLRSSDLFVLFQPNSLESMAALLEGQCPLCASWSRTFILPVAVLELWTFQSVTREIHHRQTVENGNSLNSLWMMETFWTKTWFSSERFLPGKSKPHHVKSKMLNRGEGGNDLIQLQYVFQPPEAALSSLLHLCLVCLDSSGTEFKLSVKVYSWHRWIKFTLVFFSVCVWMLWGDQWLWWSAWQDPGSGPR